MPMYAQLTLTLKQGIVVDHARSVVRRITNHNAISAYDALDGNPLQADSNRALGAEFVASQATVIYFMQGTDVVVATILAQSIPQLKNQCMRVSRQLRGEGLRLEKSNATVLVSIDGTDIDILTGSEVRVHSRIREWVKEKFLDRFLPTLITVSLTAHFMAGTPAVISAAVASVSVLISAIWYLLAEAVEGSHWDWRESK
jgi:hypothetical protein